jgi:cation diffusion facilitator CzcD-associated flavoprotein CzcO
MTDTAEHFDVLIVGAGLSGIGAGYHLQEKCPGKSYVILEGRDCIGGTWDLFRYPGIRSDSDMYNARLFLQTVDRAEGDRRRAADSELRLRDRCRQRHRQEDPLPPSRQARRRGRRRIRAGPWKPSATVGEGATEIVSFTCNFLFMCSGYYKYEEGYTPEFSGTADFDGQIVHPQKWPGDLDYAGKRVVVIGSGATAVTLVPEMAKTASHVTMLQRSPTYVVARPAEDALANKLRRNLSAKLAYHMIRWRNVLFGMYFFQLCRRKPDRAKQLILGGVKMALGPEYDVAKHFTPRYNPWEQRLCLVPDGDLFKSIRDKRASVVTHEIDTFTKGGIKLKDGSELEADIIVTATGLNLQVLGGLEVSVDGRTVDFAANAELQGHDVFGYPEHGLGVRLHQRVVDAEMRSHLRICLPADQLHGPQRLQAVHAA